MKINLKSLRTIEQIDSIIVAKKGILVIGHDAELNIKLMKFQESYMPTKLREQIRCFYCRSMMPRNLIILLSLDIIVQGIDFDDIIKITNINNPEIEMRDEIQELNLPIEQVGWFFPFEALNLNIKLRNRVLECPHCGAKNDFSFIYLRKEVK